MAGRQDAHPVNKQVAKLHLVGLIAALLMREGRSRFKGIEPFPGCHLCLAKEVDLHTRQKAALIGPR